MKAQEILTWISRTFAKANDARRIEVLPGNVGPERGYLRFSNVIDAINFSGLVKQHNEWIISNGVAGNRLVVRDSTLRASGEFLSKGSLRAAVFLDCDLSGVNFSSCDLREGIFTNCRLVSTWFNDARIGNSDFSNADCTLAEFQRADLNGAKFRNALLRDSNFDGARGLTAEAIAGADVANASFPDSISKFEGLGIVAETSKNAQKVFFALILGCLYSWLTIATTTDAHLLGNSSTSPLPIIGSSISVVGFYWVAPLVLLAIYLYFHIYLQRLWECLALLPAVFPDGVTLDRRAYPWFLNGLVRSYFARLQSHRLHLYWLQYLLSVFLAYWLVPVTMIMFWLRYIVCAETNGTTLHVILVALSVWLALIFQKLMSKTLRLTRLRPVSLITRLTHLNHYVPAFLLIALWLVFHSTTDRILHPENQFSAGRNATNPSDSLLWTRPQAFSWKDPGGWLTSLLERSGYNPALNFDNADLSVKPPSWSGTGASGELALVRGAVITDRRLVLPSGVNSFLVKSEWRNCEMLFARWTRADFRHSSFGISVDGGVFDQCNFQNAEFAGAAISACSVWDCRMDSCSMLSALFLRTKFETCSLRGADMRADFNGVSFDGCDLSGAELSGALFEQKVSLAGADLTGANLSGASLTGLTDWEDIKSVLDLNIEGTFNAPRGFEEWALAHGAVKMREVQWKAYRSGSN